jgi:hypothetical protein
VATPASIQHRFRQFEPGAFAPISTRLRARPRADTDFAASPIDILVARFPVTRRLVGDESFRAMARRFVVSEPPPCSSPLYFGETFPHFLRSVGTAASIEYVADIAELEMARRKAQHAAAVVPADAQMISSLAPRTHGDVHVVLHPSVFLVPSRFPIVTVWRNNRLHRETALIERWRAESALVARPFRVVEVQCLPNGGHAFICALAAGHTIAMAVEAGKSITPDFDIACNLAFLAEAGIVVGLRNKEAVS